jgi:hypothetical protein
LGVGALIGGILGGGLAGLVGSWRANRSGSEKPIDETAGATLAQRIVDKRLLLAQRRSPATTPESRGRTVAGATIAVSQSMARHRLDKLSWANVGTISGLVDLRLDAFAQHHKTLGPKLVNSALIDTQVSRSRYATP